ncbi:plasmid maintenance protein [Borreliella burgdorferi]|uniref:plasmid maintenance protein n=1 Tax=Borreliella burgdorferi TaxID=139 RepID=UPI001E5DF255|nr:plasmid maintenance protein [Borreliella burgdorferi]MCD2385003.1 plasmid maintenance protein [Borreliella burgdorferi]MCD2393520.1 plasmid maintenance protein [Borreliella burgdorferi]
MEIEKKILGNRKNQSEIVKKQTKLKRKQLKIELEKKQLELKKIIEKQLHQLEIEFTRVCLLYEAVHYLNLKLNNYSQKKLLKFYNEILEKNNQNSCDLQTMKKYLDILEKTKTIVKLSFKNKPTYMIYYKINYPFKGFSSTLQDYYLLISDKLKQQLEQNDPTTI